MGIKIVNESELMEESKHFASEYLKDKGFDTEQDLATKHYIHNAAHDGFIAGIRYIEEKMSEESYEE